MSPKGKRRSTAQRSADAQHLAGATACAATGFAGNEVVEITPVMRAAYFDKGIAFAHGGDGSAILLASDERWHTHPLQYAGAMPAYEASRCSSFPDRVAASGPNEFVALWWVHSGVTPLDRRGWSSVVIGVYLADRFEPTAVVAPTELTLPIAVESMVADPARRLIVLAAPTDCVVLRYSPDGHMARLGTRSYPALRGPWPASKWSDGAPTLVLVPPPPGYADDNRAIAAAVSLEDNTVFFLRIGDWPDDAPAIARKVCVGKRALDCNPFRMRLWRPRARASRLILCGGGDLHTVTLPADLYEDATSDAEDATPAVDLGRFELPTRRFGFVDVCDRHNLCVTADRVDALHVWRLPDHLGPYGATHIATIRNGDGVSGYRLMGLALVPGGPLGSLFACNSNSDDLRHPTLQYIQLGRPAALLTALLCLRRVAPAVYAAGTHIPAALEIALKDKLKDDPSAHANGSTTAAARTPRHSCILQTICEMAGLEPPRCKCGDTYRCECYGNKKVWRRLGAALRSVRRNS